MFGLLVLPNLFTLLEELYNVVVKPSITFRAFDLFIIVSPIVTWWHSLHEVS